MVCQQVPICVTYGGHMLLLSVLLFLHCRAMVRSSNDAAMVPMFHYFDDINMDPLMTLRQSLRNDPTLQGTKLTYLPFIIKALSVTLSKIPAINACLAPEGDVLLQHHTHNIGVAMATSGGLVVPNIKQVRAGALDIGGDAAEHTGNCHLTC